MIAIKAEDIRQKIRVLWPAIGFIWLVDDNYLIPTHEKIKDFLKQSTLDKLDFIDSINDCDDFALQLHAEAKRHFHTTSLQYPLAFGECFATRWNGWSKKHNGNICLCEEGIFLIEPQTDEFHKGHSTLDEILIIRM